MMQVQSDVNRYEGQLQENQQQIAKLTEQVEHSKAGKDFSVSHAAQVPATATGTCVDVQRAREHQRMFSAHIDLKPITLAIGDLHRRSAPKSWMSWLPWKPVPSRAVLSWPSMQTTIQGSSMP